MSVNRPLTCLCRATIVMSEPMPSLLLIDDDVDLAHMLVEFLELQGFAVTTAPSGEAGLQQIAVALPDLVVLDVMLPGIDGFAVLQQIRRQHDLPVVMLTARGEESERIRGLTVGADDYLPKPFNPLELAARISNVLRRTEQPGQALQALRSGLLHLDRKRRELKVNNTEVQLTAAELRVLEQLLLHPGEVISRERLTETALDRPFEAFDRSVDTLISKLRRKLGAGGLTGDCIRSVRGHGYVLDPELTDSPAR